MNNSIEENTSSHGAAAKIPPGVDGWSWGAFFLNWIWGLCNGVYISLLVFIPLLNIVMMFVLGFKGREWAWRAKHWESVEHFKKIQRRWSQVAIGILISIVLFIILVMSTLSHVFSKSVPTQVAVALATSNTEVVAQLGDQIQTHCIKIGNLENNADGTGLAKLSIPISGTRGSGMLYLKACELANQWYVVKLVFGTDHNQPIDLTPKTKPPCQYQENNNTDDNEEDGLGMNN